MGYILFNHVPGIASNMIKIIGASRAYNIAWQAWNTGQSVLRANTGMMEMMTWKGEMLTCNFQEYPATEAKSEMGEVTIIRRVQFTGVLYKGCRRARWFLQ